MNNIDIMTLIALIATTIAVVTVIVNLIDKVISFKHEQYDSKKLMVNLDNTREYYEKMLYNLQMELSDNERRWKDINHLLINAQKEIVENEKNNIKNDNKNIEFVFSNLGVDITEINRDDDLVFVLTPFIDKEVETFIAVKEACNDVSLQCIRGDEEYRENEILTHIITNIAKASVIIANINGRNPNVFYELGICHAIGKPVILISKNRNSLPFDIKGKSIVFYNDLEDLKKNLKNELLKFFVNNKKNNI